MLLSGDCSICSTPHAHAQAFPPFYSPLNSSQAFGFRFLNVQHQQHRAVRNSAGTFPAPTHSHLPGPHSLCNSAGTCPTIVNACVCCRCVLHPCRRCRMHLPTRMHLLLHVDDSDSSRNVSTYPSTFRNTRRSSRSSGTYLCVEPCSLHAERSTRYT